jgi:hypothetical protein
MVNVLLPNCQQFLSASSRCMLLYFVLLLSDGKHYKEIPLLTRLGLPHPGDEEFVTIRRDSPINVGKPTNFE